MGYCGQIVFKSGQKRYFRYSSIDLNTLGASEISKDKDFSNFFMKRMGYPIVPGSKTFFSDQWAKKMGTPDRTIHAAYRYAQKLGFPVVVKPNSGSQGKGVFLACNKKEFYCAMHAIFQHDRVGLVQRQVVGKDYRVVVLDNKVISAYERIPLNVTGDGLATVLGLLKAKQHQFVASSRDTKINSDDLRIAEKLKQQGLTFASIPLKGERIFLLNNANLSSGGDSVDVTNTIHPAFREIAVKLTKDMGLRLCGVDLMIKGDISRAPDTYWVIEINSAPGLDHYAQQGVAQEKIVEKMYLEVLKSMEKIS